MRRVPSFLQRPQVRLPAGLCLVLCLGACQVLLATPGTRPAPSFEGVMEDLPDVTIEPPVATPDGVHATIATDPEGFVWDSPDGDPPSSDRTGSGSPDGTPVRTPLSADPDAPPVPAGTAPIHEGPAQPVTPVTPPAHKPTGTRMLSDQFGAPPPSDKPAPRLPDAPTAPSSSAELGELPGFGPVAPVEAVGGTHTPPVQAPPIHGSQPTPVDAPVVPPTLVDAPLDDVGLEMPPPSAFPRLPGEPEPVVVAPPEATGGFEDPQPADGPTATGGFTDADPTPENPWDTPPAGTPPPSSTASGSPDGAPPAPVDPDNPWGPETPDTPPSGTTPTPLPPADTPAPREGPVEDENPWGPPSPDTNPAAPADPTGEDSPWGAPPSGTTPTPEGFTDFSGASAKQRAQEHATRLQDRPGDPKVPGYPTALINRADPSAALKPGARPCVVVFYDDTSRASDLVAARLVPVLVKYAQKIDVVAVDRGPRRPAGTAHSALARKYLNGVPTVAVLPPSRESPGLFFRDISAADVEAALVDALRAPAAPTTPVGGVDAEYRPPDRLDGMASPPSEPPPLAGTADRHARRLRDRAGDGALVGYPTTLVRTVNAKTVLEPGRRPAVIIFYDNSSKASDLQAADFLPVLARHNDDIDLVVMDVGPKARWNAIDRKVVLTYYMSFVPTTVVLTARRHPVKSWFHRISGASLDRAIRDALERK